jgi:hypothetical protein
MSFNVFGTSLTSDGNLLRQFNTPVPDIDSLCNSRNPIDNGKRSSHKEWLIDSCEPSMVLWTMMQAADGASPTNLKHMLTSTALDQ